jgi:hypothetical protein
MVNTTQITKIANGLRALAQSCDDSRTQIESSGRSEAMSSNFISALRGCELIIRFVNGLAGTATTAKYMDDLAPLLAELQAEKSPKLQAVADDVEAYKKRRATKKKPDA